MQMKRRMAVILALCACLTLCGAGWFDSTKVAIDTVNSPVYQYYSADDIVAVFDISEKIATEKYDDMYVLLSGKVRSFGKDNKNMVIFSTESPERDIVCTYDKSLRTAASAYKIGEKVAVYGQIKVGVFDKEISIEVDKIVKVPDAVTSTNTYYLLDGSTFHKADAQKVTLNDGGVEYYIPTHWEGIQHDIVVEGLGSMEGYQYVLNQMPGSTDAVPESLFVCYFDNEQQLDKSSPFGETQQIEKAIVENILGSAGKLPTKTVTTYYGSKYDYYVDSYRTTFEAGVGYHTEFVFQADGKDGIVVILYVYKEAKHLSDIMFLMRFLEIK
ncbi:MAG: hypothetical protein IJX63_08245 [Lachnospiraceae bacterium]|nr:hypothetical protein [Lachnospiraceae bacterium]